MPALYHDDLELLTSEEVERIHQVTDEFGIHRDFVVVPMNCSREGKVIVLPDGNLLLRAPSGAGFEPWMEALRAQLAESDLSRTPRRSEADPKRHLTGAGAPRLFGTRGHVERQPDLNQIVDPFLSMPVNGGGSSMASIRPLGEKVVVERSEAESKSAGGIVLPDSAKEKPRRGTVVAVGPGVVLVNGDVRALDVKKDDRVLFEGYAGSEVQVDGKEYLILDEKDILAVIDR